MIRLSRGAIDQARADLKARAARPCGEAPRPGEDARGMPPARRRRKDPPHPALFVTLCAPRGLGTPITEYRFASPRRWRFDFAWPEVRVALEVEGGVWRTGGGAHSHPTGILRDIEKYNRAAALGWRVVRVVPERLVTPATFRLLEALLGPNGPGMA